MLTMLTSFVFTPFTRKPFALLDGIVPQLAALLPHLVMLFVPSLLCAFGAFVLHLTPRFMMFVRAWHNYNCRPLLPERERTG